MMEVSGQSDYFLGTSCFDVKPIKDFQCVAMLDNFGLHRFI